MNVTMMSKATLGIVAGLFGTLFVGYCVYFDHKRRKDPDFKKKLRERRKANKAKSCRQPDLSLPDLRDHEAVEAFFIRQVQLGEEMLGAGDVDGGIEHLGKAVAVCGQPKELLQVLQGTLPPNVFHLLLERLPALSQRIMENPTGASMIEDDVE